MAIIQLREQIAVMIAMAASEVGGLTQKQADHWRDEIDFAVEDGLEGLIDLEPIE